MRSIYMDHDVNSIADLSMGFEDVWILHRINVPWTRRGMGHGTRLLKRVLADADAEGATLALVVYPSGPLDRDALVAWYRRNGFTFDNSSPDWEMIRYPRSNRDHHRAPVHREDPHDQGGARPRREDQEGGALQDPGAHALVPGAAG